MSIYFAHSSTKESNKEPLCDHLKLVARRASEYASTFGASEEAYLAGLLHDLGKYGELFQKRLKGEVKGIDHWSAGAWLALENYKHNGIATALAIQGHHIGLQASNKDSLARLNIKKLQTDHPLKLKLSESDLIQLLSRLKNDNVSIPDISSSIYQWGITASSMLDIRMLFSALVDADFIETEAWFKSDNSGVRQYREPGLPLEADKALTDLKSYLNSLAQTSKASPEIKKLRADLLTVCLEASNLPQGLFTLTAPTGSGKTLSMLAFALAHAVKYNLRRIIFIIPFLTIIEQTAQVYRDVFESRFSSSQLERYILEHHSLSGVKILKDDRARIEEDAYHRYLLTENWDAPIIITTNVQLLESLFSNRPSACRKLHRLASSIILFDEVQTMPVSLAIPTLAALSHLAKRYNATVVFSTATQPAFTHLNEFVKQHCSSGWQPREIVPAGLNLFSSATRSRVIWPDKARAMSLLEIANHLSRHKQVLCVVNLKKHARLLFNQLKLDKVDGVFHLSTSMCPKHRSDVLDNVHSLLVENKPCHLISTQCVEAGVDIDFPVVYRAMGPLDAIAQAAGRCNRNGHLKSGEVYVFNIEQNEKERLYPDAAYGQAASVTEILLKQFGQDGLDINIPELFLEYYRRLYDFAHPEEHKKELLEAIKLQDFVSVSQSYRVIDQDTINVLVPYERIAFVRLRNEALNQGLSRNWIMNARPFTVSLFRPRNTNDPLYLALEPIPITPGKNDKSDEWYIYRKEEDYDSYTGLNPSLSPETIIA